jgi:hypothetical protein
MLPPPIPIGPPGPNALTTVAADANVNAAANPANALPIIDESSPAMVRD